MGKSLLFIIVLFICLQTKAQIATSSQWVWVKGEKIANASGVYGTKGVAAPENSPGAREGSSSWKDAAGNLWLFGGEISTPAGLLNDLWKYDPSTLQWTWMNGENVYDGKAVYGDKGIESSDNRPGARHWAASWTDPSGNFWLFGGSGYTASSATGTLLLNDLWKYNPTTNAWTWISGDSTVNAISNYGTQGVPAASNKPGARFDVVSWVDASGKLWLFGGRGYATAGLGNLNDLWQYDPATNMWTWMKGDNGNNAASVYGTQGVPNAANKPGGRYGSAGWKDAAGNFWLFGGKSFLPISGTFTDYSDLWKYEPVTNQWTFMKGDMTTNASSVYGTQGLPAAANRPGGRMEAATWADAYGNLWLFGGQSGSFGTTNIHNDLWSYNIASNMWTWIKGDNTPRNYGVYGTQKIASAANKPGARQAATAWTDNAGNFWLFGGSGYAESTIGDLNDLWGLGVNIVLPVTLLNLTATVEQNVVQVGWKTAQEINTSHFTVERSADGRNFSSIGRLNANGNSSSAHTYSFTDRQPAFGFNYYRIKMTDRDSSFRYSAIVNVKLSGRAFINYYPNPVTTAVTIHISSQSENAVQLRLYDINGQAVRQKQSKILPGNNIMTLDMQDLASGIYFMRISIGEENHSLQFIKK